MAQKPWERMEGESAKAFEAFRVYRDMGPERNLRAVGERLGKSRAIIERWSSSNHWIERVRSYDNELEREAYREAVKNVREMRKRHLGMAVKIQHTAMQALQGTDPRTLKPGDQLSFLMKAMELEQKIRAQMVQDTETAMCLPLQNANCHEESSP